MAMAFMMPAGYGEVMRWLLEGSKTLKALKASVKLVCRVSMPILNYRVVFLQAVFR
jgi:hypothetical protein